jgi:uncharacterized protein involved in tolerance to divalent cations
MLRSGLDRRNPTGNPRVVNEQRRRDETARLNQLIDGLANSNISPTPERPTESPTGQQTQPINENQGSNMHVTLTKEQFDELCFRAAGSPMGNFPTGNSPTGHFQVQSPTTYDNNSLLRQEIRDFKDLTETKRRSFQKPHISSNMMVTDKLNWKVWSEYFISQISVCPGMINHLLGTVEVCTLDVERYNGNQELKSMANTAVIQFEVVMSLRENNLISILRQVIQDNLHAFTLTKQLTNCRDIWEKLRSRYAIKDNIRTRELLREFANFSKTNKENLEECIHRLDALVLQINAETGIIKSQQELEPLLAKAIEGNEHYIHHLLILQQDNKSWEDICESFIYLEKGKEGQKNIIMSNAAGEVKEERPCGRCKLYGHYNRDCPQNPRKEHKAKSAKKVNYLKPSLLSKPGTPSQKPWKKSGGYDKRKSEGKESPNKKRRREDTNGRNGRDEDKRCYVCNSPDHYKYQCPKFLKTQNANMANATDKHRNNTYVNDDHDNDDVESIQSASVTVIVETKKEYLYNACISKSPDMKNMIILDSGASRHMFSDFSLFKNYKIIRNIIVKVANGEHIEVLGKGTVGPFNNVLHVPSIQKDLISTIQLDKEDHRYSDFWQGVGTVYTTKGGAEMVVGIMNSVGLYEVDPRFFYHNCATVLHGACERKTPGLAAYSAYITKEEAVRKLHLAIPISGDRLQNLVANGQLSWNYKFKPTNFVNSLPSPCPHCLQGKAVRKSFTGQWKVPDLPGRYFQADVYGPEDVTSLQGCQWVIGFVDVTSRYRWLYFTNTKCAADVVKKWLNDVIPYCKSEHNMTSFTLQTDGGEMQSDVIRAMVKEHAGELVMGTPYTPELQAFIERSWRVLKEIATVMMHTHNLPEHHWQDAWKYALSVTNRVPPTKKIEGASQPSPYEMHYKEVPNMDHFKTFGCRAWMIIPKEVRQKNMAAIVTQMIYVGNDEKTRRGHRLYNPITSQYRTSGHVVFEEASRFDHRLSNEVPELIEMDAKDVKQFEYLKGTRHYDNENFQLYEITRVETSTFRGVKYIVGYRIMLLPGGQYAAREERVPIFIEDLEMMTKASEQRVVAGKPNGDGGNPFEPKKKDKRPEKLRHSGARGERAKRPEKPKTTIGPSVRPTDSRKRVRDDDRDPRMVDETEELSPKSSKALRVKESKTHRKARLAMGQGNRISYPGVQVPPRDGTSRLRGMESSGQPERPHSSISGGKASVTRSTTELRGALRGSAVISQVGDRASRLQRRSERTATPAGLLAGATMAMALVAGTMYQGVGQIARRELAPYMKHVVFGYMASAMTANTNTKHRELYTESYAKFAEDSGMFVMHDEAYDKLSREAALGDPLAAFAVQTGMTNVQEVDPNEPEPQSHAEAMRAPPSEKEEWVKAEEAEMQSLKRLQVLEVVDLPAGTKTIKTKWIYKRKRRSDGTVHTYRARLVAKGFSQVYGTDYYDTYAPVARLTTLRIVYVLSAILNLHLVGMDVDAAFMNADLHEDIYIDAPVGTDKLPTGQVYKLKKALYGLKQSPKEWNRLLDTFLVEKAGLKKLKTEGCLYTKTTGAGHLLVAIYVDDIVIAGSTVNIVNSFKKKLHDEFKCKDLNGGQTLDKALNMELHQIKGQGIFLTQESYVRGILKKFKVQTSNMNSVLSPMEHRLKFHKEGATASKTMDPKDPMLERGSQKLPEDNDYREKIGALLWLSMGTRPDIAYAVSQLAKYNNDPRVAHMRAVDRVLRYLAGTQDYGILYEFGAIESLMEVHMPTGYFHSQHPEEHEWLHGFADADFANCLDNRRSVTGYAFFMSGGPISWNSRSQPTVALSSMEAEYMAACSATQEAIWLKMLLGELGIKIRKSIVLYEDNKACLAFSKNPGSFNRTKHIDYKYHFVRERVYSEDIRMEYVNTLAQTADVFTKALDNATFEVHRNKLVKSKAALLAVSRPSS